jgi:hypothetical protein
MDMHMLTAETLRTRRSRGTRLVFLLFVLCLPLLAPRLGGGPVRGSGGLTWSQDAATAALLKDGRTVWQFNYSTGCTNTYFNPLALPGGPDLTWLSPKDHPYHFALFFGWKYLNGVNYWEEAPDGTTRWSNVTVDMRPDFSALITMDLQYRPQKAFQNVLTEKRAIRIASPAADGSYFMDWRLDFTAGKEAVVMDRTPPDTAPDGNARGGYAGLSIRLARELTNPIIAATGDIGALAKNRYGFAATAAEFSGEIDGVAAGVACFDHPANPRAPTRWYGIVDRSVPFWFLNASLLQLEPYTLGAGQQLVLRYRVLIHPGRWNPARLREEQTRFVKDPEIIAPPR